MFVNRQALARRQRYRGRTAGTAINHSHEGASLQHFGVNPCRLTKEVLQQIAAPRAFNGSKSGERFIGGHGGVHKTLLEGIAKPRLAVHERSRIQGTSTKGVNLFQVLLKLHVGPLQPVWLWRNCTM